MKTILQLVLMDETGDSYYRMRWPGRALCAQDSDISLINLDAMAVERFELGLEADLLVLFQSNDLDIIPIIKQRRSLGKKTLVEYNDNFYSPPPSSPIYSPWCSPQLWQTYETIMKAGDHLVVTGEGLKSLLSEKVNCPITILENHILENIDTFEKSWVETEELRIGWAGSVGHMGDLMAILPILENFCMHHENVKLYLMGNESIPSIVKLPPNKLVFRPWGSMADYYDFLSDIHIGIAPLGDSPYNICRSDIKAIEYASRSCFPLIQNLTPYKKLIDTGIFQSFNSFSELNNILEGLNKNRSEFKNLAKKSYEYVTNNRLAVHRKERLELYSSLIRDTKNKKSKLFTEGYHELLGTPKRELNVSVTVQEAQKLLKTKDYKKTISFIKKNKEVLDFEPNFPLILAECIKHENEEEALEILLDAAERFNLDIRYRLQMIRLKKSESERFAMWQNLIDYLSRQNNHYLSFYEKMILSLLFQDIKNFQSIKSVGIRFCEIYPNNFDLHLIIGELALKEKDFVNSFNILKKAETIFNIQNSGTESNEVKFNQYLLTLIEAADYSQRM